MRDIIGVHRTWGGRWIWGVDDPAPVDIHRFFRSPFTIEELVGAQLHLAADSRYQAWLNGRFLGRGAPQGQPHLTYFDTYQLDGLLIPGRNVLAILVEHTGEVVGSRPGLLAEVVDGRGSVRSASSNAWRTRAGTAWRRAWRNSCNKLAPYQEHIDARLLPEGWERADFDDSAWPMAQVLSSHGSDQVPAVAPWSALIARDIPFLVEEPLPISAVVQVEEAQEVINRTRSEDASIPLSQPGRPLAACSVEGIGHLCDGAGACVLVPGLTAHGGCPTALHVPLVLLDLGRIATGRVELDVEADDGVSVEIGTAERLIDGYFQIQHECMYADRWLCRSGLNRIRFSNWRSVRWIRLRFAGPGGRPIRVLRCAFRAVRYPLSGQGGCDIGDACLQQVFDACRDTVALCCLDAIVDTPWREAAQWLGDVAAVTMPALHALHGETALPGKWLRQTMASRHPSGLLLNVSNTIQAANPNHGSPTACIPDYSLWWLIALRDHWLYTGDRRWIDSGWPIASGIVMAHLHWLGDDGLVRDLPYWVFLDWAQLERRGACAAYNALLYRALAAAAELAAVKGDAWMLELIGGLRAGIANAFSATFWDDERGCFDDAYRDGRRSGRFSEQANTAAMLGGLADATQTERIIGGLFEQRSVACTEAEPFFMVVVLPALRRAGRLDLALELIRRRWGGRMLDAGATTTWEEWSCNGSRRDGEFRGFLRSQSHAWSACPAEFLIRQLAGIEILAPGCTTITIDPARTSFPWSIYCPTPHGRIAISWDGRTVHVDTPTGITVVSKLTRTALFRTP